MLETTGGLKIFEGQGRKSECHPIGQFLSFSLFGGTLVILDLDFSIMGASSTPFLSPLMF